MPLKLKSGFMTSSGIEGRLLMDCGVGDQTVLVSRDALEAIADPPRADEFRLQEYIHTFSLIASDKFDRGMLDESGHVCITGQDVCLWQGARTDAQHHGARAGDRLSNRGNVNMRVSRQKDQWDEPVYVQIGIHPTEVIRSIEEAISFLDRSWPASGRWERFAREICGAASRRHVTSAVAREAFVIAAEKEGVTICAPAKVETAPAPITNVDTQTR